MPTATSPTPKAQYPENQLSDGFGNKPDLDKNLKPTNHVVETTSQAFSVCDRLISDAINLIKNAALITAKYNGAPPFNRREMKNRGKDYRRNISTGALATAIDKLPPRFYMPLKTAKYLTGGTLPPEIPNAPIKTETFRSHSTRVLRSWKKSHFFNVGLTTEIVKMGYAFAVFFDEYEWRPKMVRMDRGFVPVGTEILSEDLPFFVVKWAYQPADLLQLVKENMDAKLTDWNTENVQKAVEAATVPTNSTKPSDARSFEETIRQATSFLSYKRGSREIETYHLFAREADGRVSHWILCADGVNEKSPNINEEDADTRLLYRKFDRFDSMEEVVMPFVFQYGNGTIHGSLGAGHLLYDMSLEVERTRNESFDNLSASNKIKLQVADGKDINAVKITVNDDKIIVSGASFPTNANMPVEVDGFIALDQQQSRLMSERVGAFMPPMAVPGTSPTATETNANIQKEQEVSGAMLDNFLTQDVMLTATQLRRLYRKGNPDSTAKAAREYILQKLDENELDMLINSSVTESITAFTNFKQQQDAAFCQSVRNNPRYDQAHVEQVIAEAMVGQTLTAFILPPSQDQNVMDEATRLQQLENLALVRGTPVKPVATDNDFLHMESNKIPIMRALSVAGQSKEALVAAYTLVGHYQAHYDAAVAKKSLPKDKYNEEKQLLASWNNALESASQKLQAQDRVNAMQNGQPGAPVAPGAAAAGAPNVGVSVNGTPPSQSPDQSKAPGMQEIKSSISIQVKWAELTAQERAVIMNRIGVPELIPAVQSEDQNNQTHLQPPMVAQPAAPASVSQ